MNIEGIREFLAVSETGTFTGAARYLGVSIAHVSRHVAALEEKLGIQLIMRSTRSVKLTPQGEEFKQRCQLIRDELEDALQSVSSNSQRLEGRLRIASLSGSFADQLVAPALAKFAAENPLLEIEVDFSPRLVDLRREGYDFAIRSGKLEDSGLIARPLLSRTIVAAASKAYLEKHGTPNHPSELDKHNCILATGHNWTFNINGRLKRFSVKGTFQANLGIAIAKACEHGLGIAYMASKGYGNSIVNRSLIPILEPFWHRDHTVYLIYQHRRLIPRRVQVAMDFLKAATEDYEVI